ncbi:MAG: class I SAM-dependent methyltransferase [Pseudomonadota bacterium]
MKQTIRSAMARLVAALPSGVLTDRAFQPLYAARGYHVVPRHFYHPVPDPDVVADADFAAPTQMAGIDLNLDAQRALIESEAFAAHAAEFEVEEAAMNARRGRVSGFTGLDGRVLYHMIRQHRPKRIVEIGSGDSTNVAALALARNGDPEARLDAVEPYPDPVFGLDALERVTVHAKRVETIAFDFFSSLGDGDILFIDSSHVVKFKSDVVYEFNEILPRLQPGVFVHVHDIFLPYEYPQAFLERHTYWTEQYLLQSFLQFNAAFEILWSPGIARAHFPDAVTRAWPGFDPAEQQAGSFWMRRVR